MKKYIGLAEIRKRAKAQNTAAFCAFVSKNSFVTFVPFCG